MKFIKNDNYFDRSYVNEMLAMTSFCEDIELVVKLENINDGEYKGFARVSMNVNDLEFWFKENGYEKLFEYSRPLESIMKVVNELESNKEDDSMNKKNGYCKLGCNRLADSHGRCCSICELNSKNSAKAGWRDTTSGCPSNCNKKLSDPNDPSTCENWVTEEDEAKE